MFLHGNDVFTGKVSGEIENRVRVAFQISNGQMIACYSCGHVDESVFSWADGSIASFVEDFLYNHHKENISNLIGVLEMNEPSIEDTEVHYICGSGDIKSRDTTLLCCSEEEGGFSVTDFDSLHDACYHAFDWLCHPCEGDDSDIEDMDMGIDLPF